MRFASATDVTPTPFLCFLSGQHSIKLEGHARHHDVFFFFFQAIQKRQQQNDHRNCGPPSIRVTGQERSLSQKKKFWFVYLLLVEHLCIFFRWVYGNSSRMDFNAAFEYFDWCRNTRARATAPIDNKNKIVIIIKNDTALWSNVNLMSTQEKESVKSCGVIVKLQWLGVVNSQYPARTLRPKIPNQKKWSITFE